MKKILVLITVLCVVLLTACGSKKASSKANVNQKAKSLKVGIVLSTGGLGDKSFNDSAYRGLQMAKKKYGIEFKYMEPASPADSLKFLRQFAKHKYDLVIGVGFLMKDAVTTAAKENPNIKFAIIDETIDAPNVTSLVFNAPQASFLAGSLAAMMTKTNTIGFIGGMEVPLIKEFLDGYSQGAKYINPKIKIRVLYTSGPNPFNDPARGKESAISENDQGADVIFAAAGGTGIGVIAGAKEKGIYAIGVDSDQDYVAKGTVLTSVVKHVDQSVFLTIKDIEEGHFEPGTHIYGLKNNGVGLTNFKYTKKAIGPKKIKRIEEIRAKIIDGTIKVKN